MKYTIEQLEKMSKAQVNAVAKKLGIKYGTLSLMQTREAIVNFKEVPKAAKKEKPIARPDSKMAKCVDLYQKMKDSGRKEIIAAFVTKAGVTVKAGPTYYQLVKTKLKGK